MCFAIVHVFADAGWSSLAARRAHNPKVVGSNPAPATQSAPLFKILRQPTSVGMCSGVADLLGLGLVIGSSKYEAVPHTKSKNEYVIRFE